MPAPLRTWAGWRAVQRSPRRDPPVKSTWAVTQVSPLPQALPLRHRPFPPLFLAGHLHQCYQQATREQAFLSHCGYRRVPPEPGATAPPSTKERGAAKLSEGELKHRGKRMVKKIGDQGRPLVLGEEQYRDVWGPAPLFPNAVSKSLCVL